MSGLYLNIHVYSKVVVSRSLEIQAIRRSSNFTFRSFADYRNALSATLERIHQNAIDPQRRHQYGMISTISRGYDAPTCACLAKEIGCDEVFTFNRPSHYSNDCGTEIAKILGYSTIHECDGDYAKSNTELIEAADFASGDTGALITFEGHKELFKGKLLFCGFQGDEFWGIDHLPYENLCYPIEGSSSNSYEIFLQTNTILIMIPYIGADYAKQIYDISLSREMKPWRLGVKYDRPICRRIVEDAGVGREMFGQNKIGAGYCFHYDSLKSISKKMSPTSYDALIKFSRQLRQNPLKKFKAYLSFVYFNIPIYFPFLLSKFHIKIKMKKWKKEHLSNPVATTYILWGVEHMKKVYKNAINS